MSESESAAEMLRNIRKMQHERIETTPFEQCVEVREAGELYRNANSAKEALKEIELSQGLDRSEAEYRLKLYTALFITEPWVGAMPEIYGSRYFTGTSLTGLVADSIYSKGEIQRHIRDFLGRYVQEVEINSITIPNDPPESIKINENTREAMGEIADQVDSDSVSDFVQLMEEIESSDFDFKWIDFLVVGPQQMLYEAYQRDGPKKVYELLSSCLEDEETRKTIMSQAGSAYLTGVRREIMERAIEAHNAGNYALSVPAALTQIDGAIIEAATDLGIWDDDDDVTGTKVVRKGPGSSQHIPEFREPFKESYSRLMGRGTRRAKILHGIDTDFVNDKDFSTKAIWMAFKSFSVAGKLNNRMKIREEPFLEYLSVSCPQDITSIAARFETNEAHTASRCNDLRDQGYLEQLYNGDYTITDEGETRLSELREF